MSSHGQGGGFGQPPGGGGGGGGFGQPPGGGGGGGGGGFGQPPGAGGFGQPPFGGNLQQPQPGPGGGGGRAIEIGEVFEVFKIALGRAGKGVLGVYLVITAVRFIGTAPQWVTQYLMMEGLSSGQYEAAGAIRIASLCSSGVSVAVSIVAGTLSIGLYRAIRKQLVEGEGAVTGFGDVFGLAKARFWPTMGAYLLFALAVGVGAVFCLIPGIVAAFFFAFVPYLVAAADVEVMESFKRSIELAKKNAGPLILACVLLFVVFGIIAVVNLAIVAGLTAALGGPGIAIASSIVFLIGAALGYFVFIFMGGLFVACETAEAGIPIRK